MYMAKKLKITTQKTGIVKKTRHIPAVTADHWDVFNEMRINHNLTWDDVFKQFHNYLAFTEHLFSLPQEVDRHAQVNAATIQYYITLWLKHAYQNFLEEHIKDIPDIKSLQNNVENKPALVIGAGPSLEKYNHLDILAESDFYKKKQGTIMCCSHSLIPCLEAGIIPDYMTLTDAEDVMLAHIDADIVDQYSDQITGIFVVYTHPSVLERWKGKKIFMLPCIPDVTIPNVQAVISSLFPNMTEFNACAHVGAFTWNLAVFMGHKSIAMVGLDCGFLPDFPVKDTPYYNVYIKSHSSEKEMVDKCYHFHTHSFFGNNSYSDDIHYGFAEACVQIARIAKEHNGVDTFNCTGGGFIDTPDVIENMHLEDWLSKFKSTTPEVVW